MFYSRLSYNTNGWTSPSGPQEKSTNISTHECEFGFGFEEWLFNENFVEDGWHYEYIEGIYLCRNGNALNNNNPITLFSINSELPKNQNRFLVGEIGAYDWEMISPTDSTNFINNHPNLINQMHENIVFNNNPEALNQFNLHLINHQIAPQNILQLFNVKFRNYNFIYDLNQPTLRPHRTYDIKHFQLCSA